MTKEKIIKRKVLLHQQAPILLRQEVERHEREAEKLKEETEKKTFQHNRRFRRDYDKLFRHDPLSANTFLLFAELADERGQVPLGPFPEVKLQNLLTTRFEDCRAYQLPGGPKR